MWDVEITKVRNRTFRNTECGNHESQESNRSEYGMWKSGESGIEPFGTRNVEIGKVGKRTARNTECGNHESQESNRSEYGMWKSRKSGIEPFGIRNAEITKVRKRTIRNVECGNHESQESSRSCRATGTDAFYAEGHCGEIEYQTVANPSGLHLGAADRKEDVVQFADGL